MQRCPAQLGDLIGGGHTAQHRKARSTASIGGKPDPVILRHKAGSVEKARANKGVRRRAVDQGGTDLAQPVAFARLKMDRMAIDRFRTQQAGGLIGVEIIAGLREKVFHPSNLFELLAQVGLHQAVGVFAP